MADNIRATPQNPYTGALARGLRSLQQLAGQYQVDPRIPLLGGTNVDELLSLPGAASLAEDVSYFGPRSLIRGGNVATGGIGTFKPDPRIADVADVAMNVAPLGMAAGRGTKALGRVAGQELNRAILDSSGPLAAFIPQAAKPQYVVKPKGGNWLAGSVERAIEPMRARFDVGAGLRVDPATINREGLDARQLEMLAPTDAMNRWLDTKLGKYMRDEMATPEDPLRALAERGIMHSEITPTGYNVARARKEAGFPEEGMGVSPMAKAWEDRADTFVNELEAFDLTSAYPEVVKDNPWLLKVPPETRVYDIPRGAEDDLGFAHLTDELRNAVNPESGLPENLLWKYQDLEKVTVPQAVERVAKINEWRAAHKAEADMARAMNPATQVVKEYPEQGFKWVELRQPKELPEGWTEKNGAFYDPKGERHVHPGTESLADALKYEGETMGPFTVDTTPGALLPDESVEAGSLKPINRIEDRAKYKKLTESMRSGGWQGRPVLAVKSSNGKTKALTGSHRIAAAKATGTPVPVVYVDPAAAKWADSEGLFTSFSDAISEQRVGYFLNAAGDKRGASLYFAENMDDGKWGRPPNLYATPAAKPHGREGRGGQVRGYAQGGSVTGANSPTDDFDPARIDAIVGELHAMNAA